MLSLRSYVPGLASSKGVMLQLYFRRNLSGCFPAAVTLKETACLFLFIYLFFLFAQSCIGLRKFPRQYDRGEIR